MVLLIWNLCNKRKTFGIYYAVGKYLKRHTGVYETKEDAGEHDATDADTAVLHSKTGHLVEKKQEWFI